uniref:Putative transposase-like protein n=1 Tax=Noccaea caerulescens TaxID=107243 RepID=A0A1J3EBV6_NOCCA
MAKVHDRLPDMVSRWKKLWLAKGDAAKPLHFSPDVWKGLVAYWKDPDHLRRSDNSKSARAKSSSKSTHRSGRTSFLRRGEILAEQRGDSEMD